MESGHGVLSLPSDYGYGWEEVVPVTAPGANTNASIPIPGQYASRLLSAVFTLTTDATVASRYVTLTYTDGNGNVVAVMGAAVTVTAGSTQRYSGDCFRTVAEWNTGTDVFFPIQPLVLKPGYTIGINIGSKQAGDTLTGIQLVMQRLVTGPRGAIEIGEPLARSRA